MRDPVEAYFAELRDIRAMGGAVPEISYYGALATLLNEVGKGLKPKVRAFMQLRNVGAGNPDGGLYTQNQWKLIEGTEDPLAGQLPARGAIEVKGTSDDAFAIAESEQVARYAERYGLVLVTNLRDFVLVRWEDGAVRALESCRLAETEAGFWAHVATPQKFAEQAGEGLTEFLKRAMLQKAPLTDPKDLAWFLASYARTARLRLEHRDLPALDQLRSQLEEALGLKFEGDKGDHFFRSTLVQTLFYGVFAAWVLWSEEHATTAEGRAGRFEWELSANTLDVPMISALFYQFANPRQLGPLGISEVLDWTEDALNRVDRSAFFEKFRKDHAVQYFYEPFLEAFDPQLRKELGVWYTPDEVVKYMVARVDWALREELGIADGLADPSVYVLDPCCGTGAYLVEVLRKIDETLHAKGADALTRQDVKRAAMERVIGFEIMPAPFVVAHLQLGLLLSDLGVPLTHAGEHHERAAIYLTNALTGWGNGEDALPPKDKRVGEGQMHSTLLFPEFAEERDAASHVKREAPILVVIGNPPYNKFAGIAIGEERELSETYRKTKRVAKPQGQGLNDLYVRFFRMAERRIVERTGRGVVCMISNNSWLDGLSFTGMRERFLAAFDSIWVDNLNGDKYKTGKTTPDGSPDPSIFSTDKNREGIQVGTAIGLLVKRNNAVQAIVRYREFWGPEKRNELVREAAGDDWGHWEELRPSVMTGLPFAPAQQAEAYFSWPSIPDLMPMSFPGVTTARDDLLVDVDRDALEVRLRAYFDPRTSDQEVSRLAPSAVLTGSKFDGPAVRRRLQDAGFTAGEIIPYNYRPFDVRWLYWERNSGLLDRNRCDFRDNVFEGNAFLFTTGRTRKGIPEPALFTKHLNDYNCLDSGARGFPMLRYVHGGILALETTPNISRGADMYLRERGIEASAVFFHSLAVLHSTCYRRENLSPLRHGWPRIPLPDGTSNLVASFRLGARIAALLDMDGRNSADSGGIPLMGVLSARSSVSLDPTRDLAVTSRWGTAGKGGITMPSTGKLTEREYTADELASIAEAASAKGLSTDKAVELLGTTTYDVYLNDVAYWSNVPTNVWRYTIGGYQVIKKWLSYRERALLGRDLTPEEARYVTEMVQRIAALILMQPELDANYERVKADVWEWTE